MALVIVITLDSLKMKKIKSDDIRRVNFFASPDTEYNSVNGVRRMVHISVGTETVTYPCSCAPMIVKGKRVLVRCGCGYPHPEGILSKDTSVDESAREADSGGSRDSLDRSLASRVDGASSISEKHKDSEGQKRPGESPKTRMQPGRSARKLDFSIENYRLPDTLCHTGICYIDFESAYVLGALKKPVGDDEDNNKNLCVLLNELLNSSEAVEQIRALFTPRVLAAEGGTQFIVSKNAGDTCANGLKATIDFMPGDAVSCYGGFGINFRELPHDEESVPSDRKIVLDIEITKSCGEVVLLPSIFIGWERPEITDKFPLMRGHMINHACVNNCVIKLKPLAFHRGEIKYVIHVPVFCVCSDLSEGIKKGDEFTTDYGDEMCLISPFYKDEYQSAITAALATEDFKQRDLLLKDVPKKFTDTQLFNFLRGCAGSNCKCEDCSFASNEMRPAFCATVMNLGPNDIDTKLIRQCINYPECQIRGKNDGISSRVKGSSKSPKSSGLSSARGKRRRSPPESSKSGARLLKSKLPGTHVAQRMKRSPRRSALRKMTVSGDGGGFGPSLECHGYVDDEVEEALEVERESNDEDSGENSDDLSECGSGESDEADSKSVCADESGSAAGIMRGVRYGTRITSSSSDGRPGCTRVSRINYMPYSLAVFFDTKKPYAENKYNWVSLRNAYDYEKRKASTASGSGSNCAEGAHDYEKRKASTASGSGSNRAEGAHDNKQKSDQRASGSGLTWAEAAARLLSGPPPNVDVVSKANEFLHPPPPIPPDP